MHPVWPLYHPCPLCFCYFLPLGPRTQKGGKGMWGPISVVLVLAFPRDLAPFHGCISMSGAEGRGRQGSETEPESTARTRNRFLVTGA